MKSSKYKQRSGNAVGVTFGLPVAWRMVTSAAARTMPWSFRNVTSDAKLG
jgi:hypothetical protein